jgi:hypothetical protein
VFSRLATQLSLHPAAVLQLPTVAWCLSRLGRLLVLNLNLKRTTAMPQREPSAAKSVYPHLLSAAREPVQRAQPASVAAAMWPQLTLKPRQPQPAPEEVAREAAQFWARNWASADPAPVGFVKVGRR